MSITRNIVRRAASSVAASTITKFANHSKLQSRGLERIISDGFETYFRDCRYTFQRNSPFPPTFQRHARSIADRSTARMDCVLSLGDNEIGLEYKICHLPRQIRLGQMDALYDLGQILYDLFMIKWKCGSGYSIVALAGPLIDTSGGSSQFVIRQFHNQLFIDYSNALVAGEWSPARVDYCGKRKHRAVLRPIAREIGIDAPFRKARPSDFCVVEVKRRIGLAIVGIFIEQRLPT